MIDIDGPRWVWWSDMGYFRGLSYNLTTNHTWLAFAISKAFRLAFDFRIVEDHLCLDISLCFAHFSGGITFYSMEDL